MLVSEGPSSCHAATPGIASIIDLHPDRRPPETLIYQALRDKRGAATAKTARSVLSGICRFAARNDLLDRNPVRDTGAIAVKRQKMPTALSVAQVIDLRIWLTYDDRAIRRDIPDLVAFMLATGLRTSEASAVHWEDLDLPAKTVRLRGNVVRIKGVGLVIQEDDSTSSRSERSTCQAGRSTCS